VATYSEDGLWMWNEESSTWIPSPPSSNNSIETVASTVTSNVNSNETYCKNCGKLVYQGWEKCTSCGVFVEPLLKNTPNTNSFENQFSNPFQRESDELLASSIKKKIKTRKKIMATIFSFMLAGIIVAAGAGTFTPDCHTNQYMVPEFDRDGKVTGFSYESETVCDEDGTDEGIWETLFGFMAVSFLMGKGIIPVSIKYWRYCFPDRREIFKGFRNILITFLILFFLWAIITGWFEGVI
jgi:hypothetical protein